MLQHGFAAVTAMHSFVPWAHQRNSDAVPTAIIIYGRNESDLQLTTSIHFFFLNYASHHAAGELVQLKKASKGGSGRNEGDPQLGGSFSDEIPSQRPDCLHSLFFSFFNKQARRKMTTFRMGFDKVMLLNKGWTDSKAKNHNREVLQFNATTPPPPPLATDSSTARYGLTLHMNCCSCNT